MKKTLVRLMVLVAMVGGLAVIGGCSGKQKSTAAGAALGLAAGTGIGALAGGGDGAIIGAITGGLFGGILGNSAGSDDEPAAKSAEQEV